MKLAVLKETRANEPRVALTPAVVQNLTKAGFQITVESGAGLASSYSDEAYTKAGAQLASSAAASVSGADVVIKIGVPQPDEVHMLPEGCALISFVYGSMNTQVVQALNQRKVSVLLWTPFHVFPARRIWMR